jgi:hypothetical protein
LNVIAKIMSNLIEHKTNAIMRLSSSVIMEFKKIISLATGNTIFEIKAKILKFVFICVIFTFEFNFYT